MLSFDPGSRNFAWCVSEHKWDGVQRSRVVANGLMDSVKQLEGVDQFVAGGLQEVVAELEDLMWWYMQKGAGLDARNMMDCICIERFMARGVMVGGTSELTNMIIGAAVMLDDMYRKTFGKGVGLGLKVITPASWKNAFDRMLGKGKLKETYKMCRAKEHQLDASLIGCYAASRIFNARQRRLQKKAGEKVLAKDVLVVPFEHLKVRGAMDKLLLDVESTSREDLINRRRKRD